MLLLADRSYLEYTKDHIRSRAAGCTGKFLSYLEPGRNALLARAQRQRQQRRASKTYLQVR